MSNRREFVSQVGTAAALSVLPGIARQLSGADQAQPPIKVGQIGVGHGHANKIEVFRRSSDFEVVGIVEPDAGLRQRAVNQPEYQDLDWMTEEQLLNIPGLEAVLVETRVRDLLTTAETCIAAGKHIHLDKPAGESLPQFRRILDSASQKKRLVQMGYMYRYNPAIILLRDFLRKGWLGDPFELHAVMSKVVSPDSRREFARYRGGIMFELGCHLVDQVIGIFGKPDKVSSFQRQVAANDDVLLDNMLAVFEYPRAIATVKSSAVEVEGFERRHLVVCGTEGTFHIQPLDDPAARFALTTPRAEFVKGYQDITFPQYDRYVADAADMARIIRGEKTADFSYEHDWLVQSALLEACGLKES